MCRVLLSFFFYSAAFLAFVAFMPGLPPFGIDVGHKEFERIPLVGKLSPNNRLDALFEPLTTKVEGTSLGKLKGPESFAIKDGYIYTGIVGGEIMRIKIEDVKDGVWQTVFRAGEKCTEQYEETVNGRPIAIEFDSKNRMVVVDVYLGIYRVSEDFSTFEVISSPSMAVDGQKSKFANNIAITSDDSIYYTIYDSNFAYNTLLLGNFAEGSGRLIKWDSKTKSLSSLMNNLNCGNGVILSSEEDYLLVSELGAGIIWKYHLKGQKSGKAEILLKLPGLGDNINSNGKGGYLVTIMHIPEDKFNPLVDVIYKYPVFRRVLLRVFYALWSLPGLINEYIYSDPTLQRFSYYFMNLETVLKNQPLVPGFVIEFDVNGNILQTWQSQSRKVTALSEAKYHNGYIYLGSYINEAFVRIPYSSAN